MLSRSCLLAACAVVLGACQEDLGGGAACPALCPGQELIARDTLLHPVSFDSTISGYPPVGAEPYLLLARRGDSLVTAVVARFDTLSTVIRRSTTDTVARPVTGVDSAEITLEVMDTLAVRRRIVKAPVTIDVYDVDTTGTALDPAAERVLLRPDRLVASRTFPTDSLTGTLRIPLPTDAILQRILSRRRVRFGFLAQSDSSAQLALHNTTSRSPATPPTLRYTARADTATLAVPVQPTASASGEPGPSGADLADYVQVLAAPSGAPPGTMAVGGLPASRAYLRFALPSGLIESTTVVRASLLLTQTPNRTIGSADSTQVIPRIVLASASVPPSKAALLLGNPVTTLGVVPQDSGLRSVDVVNVVRQWRTSDTTRAQRALVLQLGDEGTTPQAVHFFSSTAPFDTLRPRLRLSYIPRAGFGLP